MSYPSSCKALATRVTLLALLSLGVVRPEELRGGEVLLIADAQLHELGSRPFRGRSLFSDRLSSVAVRPVPQDLFGDALLEEVLASAPKTPLTLFGGDLADVSCVKEIRRGFQILNAHGLWFGAPGNHDGFLQGNLSRGWRFRSGSARQSKRWSKACPGPEGPADKFTFIVLYLENLKAQCDSALSTCDSGLLEFREFLELASVSKPPSSADVPRLRECHSGDRFLSALETGFDAFLCGEKVSADDSEPVRKTCPGRGSAELVPFPPGIRRGVFCDPARGLFRNLYFKRYTTTRLPAWRAGKGDALDPHSGEVGRPPADAGVFVASRPDAILRALVWYLNPYFPENSFLLQVVDAGRAVGGESRLVLIGDTANPARAAERYAGILASPIDRIPAGTRGRALFKALQYQLFLTEYFEMNSVHGESDWVLFQHHPTRILAAPVRKDLALLAPSLVVSAHTHRGTDPNPAAAVPELNLASTSDWATSTLGPSIVLWDPHVESVGGSYRRLAISELGSMSECRQLIQALEAIAPESLAYKRRTTGIGPRALHEAVSELLALEIAAWSRFENTPAPIRSALDAGLGASSGRPEAAKLLRDLDWPTNFRSSGSEEDWVSFRRLAACRAFLAAEDEEVDSK